MMLICSICLNLLFMIMIVICNICCCCSCFRCCRCCVMKRKSDRIQEGAADKVRVLVEEDGKQHEKKQDHKEKQEQEQEEEEEEEEYDMSQNPPTEDPIYATVDRRNRSKYLDVEKGIEVTPGTMDRFFTQDHEIPPPLASSETSRTAMSTTTTATSSQTLLDMSWSGPSIAPSPPPPPSPPTVAKDFEKSTLPPTPPPPTQHTPLPSSNLRIAFKDIENPKLVPPPPAQPAMMVLDCHTLRKTKTLLRKKGVPKSNPKTPNADDDEDKTQC